MNVDKQKILQEASSVGRSDAIRFSKYTPENSFANLDEDKLSDELRKAMEAAYRKGYFNVVNYREKQKEAEKDKDNPSSKKTKDEKSKQKSPEQTSIFSKEEKKSMKKARARRRRRDAEPDI